MKRFVKMERQILVGPGSDRLKSTTTSGGPEYASWTEPKWTQMCKASPLSNVLGVAHSQAKQYKWLRKKTLRQ